MCGLGVDSVTSFIVSFPHFDFIAARLDWDLTKGI